VRRRCSLGMHFVFLVFFTSMLSFVFLHTGCSKALQSFALPPCRGKSSMYSPEEMVARKIAELGPLLKGPDGEIILHVAWKAASESVTYGCKLCMRLVADNTLRPCARYRDPAKSNSLIWGNVYKDVKRTLETHPRTKTHQAEARVIT
jgi:hypothetical protein